MTNITTNSPYEPLRRQLVDAFKVKFHENPGRVGYDYAVFEGLLAAFRIKDTADVDVGVLSDIRKAIINADPQVLTCTLWMPEEIIMGATVVDYIDMAMMKAMSSRSAEAGKPVVKGLEWRTTADRHDAGSIVGRYTIEGRNPGYGLLVPAPVAVRLFIDLDAAKAAAQADYEARVRSALSTPAEVVRSQTLIEAARIVRALGYTDAELAIMRVWEKGPVRAVPEDGQ